MRAFPNMHISLPGLTRASADEGLDDQGEHAGGDDAVHPFQRLDLGFDDREDLVQACES